MPSDPPTPELIRDTFEPNPLGPLFENFSVGSLLRVYSTPGFPPVRVRLNSHRDGKPWGVQVDAMGPDGSWNIVHLGPVPAQPNYGEDGADRQAALAIRLLAEAREAARNG